jgi:lipoate-protein ligase A
MAIDRWLFEQCSVGQHPPVLRFYTWTPAAISMGYHQHQWPQHWHGLRWRDQPMDVVRRPTGGRAVLHADDLTYSLVLPNQTGHRRQTYAYICEFLIQGWRALGVSLQFGTASRGYHRQVNCFANATAADLVGPQGEKFIGSAQAWRGQTVLQHGSMQLQANPELWHAVFGKGAITTVTSYAQHSQETIINALVRAAEQQFQIKFQPNPLTPSEWNAIQDGLP